MTNPTDKPGNPHAHIATLIDQGRHLSAHNALETADAQPADIIKLRERMQGRIGDPGFEALNDNALALAHVNAGNLDAADAAYTRALTNLAHLDAPRAAAEVRFNAAALLWHRGDRTAARAAFEQVRADAERDGVEDVAALADEWARKCGT